MPVQHQKADIHAESGGDAALIASIFEIRCVHCLMIGVNGLDLP